MQLQLDGYAIQTVMQALQESDRLWDERIAQAEAGERPNFSIEGAKMMRMTFASRCNRSARVDNSETVH